MEGGDVLMELRVESGRESGSFQLTIGFIAFES
jgi:hypothetical protein